MVHRDSKEPLYKLEMTLIGEKGDRANNESPNETETEHNVVDPIDAQLQIDENDFEELHRKVILKVKEYVKNKFTSK